MARVLVAEDDPVSAILVSRALGQAGHRVAIARNGLEALQQLQAEAADVLVTDWMMPELDGLELIRKVHQRFDPVPVIVMLTCIDMPQARAHALDSGAEEILTKPVRPQELLAAVDRGLARRAQMEQPTDEFLSPFVPAAPSGHAPAFPLVVVGANAGGPAALRLLLRNLPTSAEQAAFVIAQHLQPQMLDSLVPALQRETRMPVSLAVHGQPLTPGTVLVAPGGRHACISADGRRVELNADPEENHVRPAADPLFRSAAAAYGPACIAVVLTGMGRDGLAGTSRVRAAGGSVFVTTPAPTIASGMPESVFRAGLATSAVPLDSMGPVIGQAIEALERSATQMHVAV
jgi:two-component system chemotaxis response regulator CheB